MTIRILSSEVAAKIAAGEVIERPASVVKELVENAIDAGASDVRVEVIKGGRRLIRVTDDGCGIDAAEVDLAFERHATSKLSTAEDLYRVRTLGFRGEALASIAAVSRLTLSTCAEGEKVGTVVRLEGGAIVHRESRGRPAGTTIQVENLFFNTPARLKFLRSDPTESGHIARLMTSYALAYPERRFALQHNDRLVMRTMGTGELYDVLVGLYGLDVAEQMIPIEPPTGSAGGRGAEPLISVWGYVGVPALHRSNRRDITFFVNRRWIQDNSLSYAASEAYRTLLPQRRYPMAVLNIELPPEEVDVNIHPTKREVRFRRDRQVFSAVQRAVRATIMALNPIPVVQVSTVDPTTGMAWQGVASFGGGRGAGPLSPDQVRMALDVHRAAGRSAVGVAPGDATTDPSLLSSPSPSERLPMLRVIGQIAQTYIIAEGPGGMYLVDQHAAHERIRYEQLEAQRIETKVASQEMLDPLPIEMSPQQAALLQGHLGVLDTYGFEIAPFGGTTFLVKRIPASLVGGSIVDAIAEIVDAALVGDEGFSWDEQALITLTCHTAIRAGQTLALEEMRDLVRQLERCSLPHTCPHGRPTMMHLSRAQLEREFGRR